MTSEIDKNVRTERDKDIEGAEAALRRAARRARDLAKEKGSYIVIFRDGEIQQIQAEDID